MGIVVLRFVGVWVVLLGGLGSLFCVYGGLSLVVW